MWVEKLNSAEDVMTEVNRRTEVAKARDVLGGGTKDPQREERKEKGRTSNNTRRTCTQTTRAVAIEMESKRGSMR